MGKPTSNLLQILSGESIARKVLDSAREDQGLADDARFPFLAIVDQHELKLALLLSLVNRNVGGVLLIGPRGTGKTTAVRGLVELMPTVNQSLCPYGCEEEAAFNLGIDAVCADCAVKIGQGEPLTQEQPMRLLELPLNTRIEDVVGGINERVAIEQRKIQLNRGILSYADQNILYIDEVNLLDDSIVNAILDAAAQGMFTVRRGPMAATYRSRLFLVGSMNPEEGHLRPQIQDRFGLRVLVRGLDDQQDRLEVYRRSVAYQQNPHKFIADWRHEITLAAEDIIVARKLLNDVTFEAGVEEAGLKWVQSLEIESHRAEITMLEGARAYAAIDGRNRVTIDDVRIVAPMALRQRQSAFMREFMAGQAKEDKLILDVISGVEPEKR